MIKKNIQSKSVLSLALLLIASCNFGADTVTAEVGRSEQVADWPSYGGSLAGSQYTELDEISVKNINKLKVAWTYRLPPLYPPALLEQAESSATDGESKRDSLDDVSFQFQNQPLVVGNKMYACSPSSQVFALDANTGESLWFYDYKFKARPSKGYPVKCRGVAYWENAAEISENNTKQCQQRIFVANFDAELVALDAQSGTLCSSFGDAGKVFLYENIESYVPGFYGPTSSPMVLGDKVIVGARVDDNIKLNSPSGVIRAYDVISGKLIWAWNPVHPDVDPMVTTEQGETYFRSGTVNSWAPMTADLENGLLYVPTGNPSPDLYGGQREGSDYYGSSVVALDINSGKVRWHYQTVNHDVWDYDVGSMPALFQIPGVGGGKQALALPTKLGHIFLLDRLTGEPLYPVEDRAVPQGGVPGEQLAATQPFPTHPESIHPLDIEPWGFTPFDKNACAKRIKQYRWEGIFTPPSLEGTIQFPGSSGGMNWGSAAIDSQSGILYINQSHMAWVIKLIPREEMDQYDASEYGFPNQLFPMTGTPYGALRFPLMSPLGAPCAKTPWGTISAVDLKSGELLWQKPLGTTRDLAPWPLWLNIGTPNFGGVLATAGGVVFSTGTTDHFVRAFDAKTGDEVWKKRTEGIVWATPISFKTAPDRSQKVVVAVSSGDNGYSLVAYDL